ncbi:hypothetical protein [Rhodococcus ruber]|uniref:hypothetical protein n=1 Tax=Rhodococcus ruber TaxID=1830 RepID=UPI003783FAEF
MNARNELMDLIDRTTNSYGNKVCDVWLVALTDAILAAGYRNPHTITTPSELETLPDNSVVLVDVTAYQKHGHDAWAGADWNDEYDYTAADLIREASRYNTQTPRITVIYTPGEAR